jgi:2'-5' RNA ligase
MNPTPRYAIYYTPPPFSHLARFGAGILGYDCYHGTDVPQSDINGADPAVLRLMTVVPRRYGFHATIVAPFNLHKCTELDVADDIAAFARDYGPVMLGPLAIGTFQRFVVLTPFDGHNRIAKLASDCVKAFDRYRAPLSAVDRERRAVGGLTPRQIALMDRWGYPYVLDQFQFHMTLAGPVPEVQMAQVQAALSAAYEPLAGNHFEVDALSLMRQNDRSERFRVVERYRLRGSS